jgi:multimeric flavodoxin WrbA
MSEMRVLGVNGSGRVGGNTAVLAGAILRGAADGGCQTSLLELGPLALHGCTACKGCKDTQCCVLDDDMKRFYDVAADIDVLVLTSPVYLDHITAQLMAFIQRTYCYLGRALENYYPNKQTRIVLGITYGAGTADGYDYILDWMAARMKGYFGLETVGSFKIPQTTHEPILTDSHPEIQRAYEFGKTLTG